MDTKFCPPWVTDLSPESKVKASMNEINASRRLKEAASHKAEADKIRQVKGAEAEAEDRYPLSLWFGCGEAAQSHCEL
jgi:hypothetical protein